MCCVKVKCSLFPATRLWIEANKEAGQRRLIRRNSCDHRGVQRTLRQRGQRPSQSRWGRGLCLQWEGKSSQKRRRPERTQIKQLSVGCEEFIPNQTCLNFSKWNLALQADCKALVCIKYEVIGIFYKQIFNSCMSSIAMQVWRNLQNNDF